ncbi:MAG: chloride channel protein, partial [Phototrophicaceae bacterium]
MILAVTVGLATGLSIWLFRLSIEAFHIFFFEVLQHDVLGALGPFSVVLALGLAGYVVGLLMQRFVGEERHHGVAGIMEAVALSGGRLRYTRMPFKALASALSLGAGASVGPEDPSVQIGSNLGSMFGQRLALSEERISLLVASGAASAIAAAFNAPIAGVFFALEVVLGEFTTRAFGVVVLAAVLASVITQAL